MAAGVYNEDGELLGVSSSKSISIKDGYLYSSLCTFNVGSILATLPDGEYIIKTVSRETRSGVGTNDFFFMKQEEPEKVAETIVSLVRDRLPKAYRQPAANSTQCSTSA